MTSNVFLNSVLRKYCGSSFSGVYSSDNLPSLEQMRGKSLICNLSKSNSPGTHFIAAIIDRSGRRVLIVDSYGIPLFVRRIRDSFRPAEIYFSRARIQSSKSTACGFFAMLICLAHANGDDIERLYSNFDQHDLRKNDRIASRLIAKYLRLLAKRRRVVFNQAEMRNITQLI